MKKESKPKIVFFLTKEKGHLSRKSMHKLIMLTLEQHKHNDFGLYSVFDYTYFIDGEEIISGWFKVALINSKESSNRFIQNKLKDANSFQFKDGETGFYSLQQSIQDYRAIVKKLGVDGAKEFLLAINDVVAIKKYKTNPEWITKALDSNAFKNSLSRTSQSYFAYMNGASVLDGVEYEEIGKISDLIYLEGEENISGFNVRPPLVFEFNFQSFLPSRVVTLIGKNGVGKSQSLKILVESFVVGNGKIKNRYGERPQVNRLLAIATAGEVQNTFPRPRKKSLIDYRLISHRRSRHNDNENGLSGLIVRLLRSDERIGEYRRIDLFREAIQAILPLEKIGLIISETESDTGQILENPQFEPMPLSEFNRINESGLLDLSGRVQMAFDPIFLDGNNQFPLSSGQISFLRLAAQLCLHIENGSLVLLDEPETHFHPNLITDLMSFLTRILELSGSVAVLATHSAYFVREVPRKQVLVMNRMSDGTVEVVRPRIKTLGAEIGEISFSVFGEQDFGNLIETIKHKIQTSINSEGFIASDNFAALVDELPSEAIMYLENELKLNVRSKLSSVKNRGEDEL